jgi:hypothetical protein
MDRVADFACSIMKRRSKAISFAFEMGSGDTVAPGDASEALESILVCHHR